MKNILVVLISFVLLLSCKTGQEIDVPLSELKEDIIELETSYGKMYIWLYKATPLHRENFLKLSNEGFFNQTTFHRIIPNFMIQGGDPLSKDSVPTNDGTGGPGYTIPNEIRDSIKHDKGSLAAARLSDNVNPSKSSSGSQFYISVSKSGTAQLDGKYTVFGEVMKGIEYADEIVKQPRDNKDRPNSDIKMTVKVIQKTLAEIKSEFGYTPKY
ncbi:MAG: peptidylprolyl isomerase [Bacteroidota bacterium]|nr:peptidylprolyl isomerase [Bacteroidota bacterium]